MGRQDTIEGLILEQKLAYITRLEIENYAAILIRLLKITCFRARIVFSEILIRFLVG